MFCIFNTMNQCMSVCVYIYIYIFVCTKISTKYVLVQLLRLVGKMPRREFVARSSECGPPAKTPWSESPEYHGISEAQTSRIGFKV